MTDYRAMRSPVKLLARNRTPVRHRPVWHDCKSELPPWLLSANACYEGTAHALLQAVCGILRNNGTMAAMMGLHRITSKSSP